MTTGSLTVACCSTPCSGTKLCTVPALKTIAFSGMGHSSWQTRQSRPSDHGMQVLWSMYARPITFLRFSLEGQLVDGLRRAYLAALVAVPVAGASTIVHLWVMKPSNPASKTAGWMTLVGQPFMHWAQRAQVDRKSSSASRARRSDKVGIALESGRGRYRGRDHPPRPARPPSRARGGWGRARAVCGGLRPQRMASCGQASAHSRPASHGAVGGVAAVTCGVHGAGSRARSACCAGAIVDHSGRRQPCVR